MPLALCEPITFGCDSGPARRPHHINILHLKMLFNTGVLSPPGRPTDQSQGFSGTAFRSTSQCFPVTATSQPSAYTQGQVYTLAPSTGQPPLQGHPKAPQDAQPWMEAVKAGLCIWGPIPPLAPPPVQVKEAWDHTTDITSSPSTTGVTTASTCVPHSVAEARDTAAGQVGLPRAACGSKVGWDRAARTTPEILGGVRCCLSPKARCPETGATPSSRNKAPALGTQKFRVGAWSSSAS